MAFPGIPATGSSTLLTSQAVGTGTARTFPSLTSLAKGSGDLLVAVIVAYQASATNATFSGWGGGFTEFADTGNSTTPTTAIGAAYKWSDGTETGTFTVTQAATITGDAVMFLMAIPGAHASTPPAAGALATGTTTAADPASFTSGFGAVDTLWIAVCGSSETSTTSTYTGCASAPANYTGYAEAGMTRDAVGACDGSVSFRQLNAASEDVGTAGVDTTNARNAALVIAVPPSANVTQAAGYAEGGGGASDATAVTQDGVVSSTESLDTVSVQVLYVPPPAITPAAASGAGAAYDAKAGALVTVTPASADGAGEAPFVAGYSASFDLIADDAVSAAGEALNATPTTARYTNVTPAAADGAGAAYDGSTSGGPVIQAATSADAAGAAYAATVTASGAAVPGSADGTGAAYAAAVTAPGSVPAGSADGTAAGYDAAVTGTGTAFPAQAAAAGAAYDAAVTTGLIAYPGSADGTGAALDAAVTASGTAAPAQAAATGTAYDITPVTAGTTYAQAAPADAAALAYDIAVSGSGTGIPAAADGTGQGLDAGATAASTVAPVTASATGVAYDANPAVTAAGQVLAGAADGTGQALDAAYAATGTAVPPQADGTGQALDAAPSTASYTNVTAGSADGTGAAYDAGRTATCTAQAAPADGTGQAYDAPPGGSASMPATLAAAAGTAYDAQPVYGRLTLPGSGDGAGTALDAVICITIAIDAAEAAAQALAAYIPPQVVFGRSVPGAAAAEHAEAGGGVLAGRSAAGGVLVGTGIPGSG